MQLGLPLPPASLKKGAQGGMGFVTSCLNMHSIQETKKTTSSTKCTLSLGCTRRFNTRALRWVPIPMPMPTHAHGFWVGMGAMLLFMGGHRFCASLHPAPNRSQTSRMQEIL
jgi:hypothetical protein